MKRTRTHTSSRKGFTLVEIGIVMIIIGVLIGGILAGQSMIRTARIQAIISDFSKYKTAATDFKAKYYYWPGDQPDATTFWSSALNGDGNSQIGGIGSVAGCASAGDICASGESFEATKVLAFASYISGTYTGATGVFIPGSNFVSAPKVDSISSMSLNPPIYVYTYTTVLGMSKNVISITDIKATSKQSGAVLPDVAYAIDQKVDDGQPLSGMVWSLNNNDAAVLSSCLTGSNLYDLGSTTNPASTRKCIVSYALE